EDKALSAQERALAREKWLYEQLLDDLQAHVPALTQLARALASLDALCALAERALTLNWCAPQFVREPCIDITAGRHPVVEARLAETTGGSFIANDTRLGTTAGLFLGTGTVSVATLTATSTATAISAGRTGFVGALDGEDWYPIVLAPAGTAAPFGLNVSLSLGGLTVGSDADLELVDWNGAVVARSSVAGSGAEGLAANGLTAGSTYTVHVLSVAGDTGYTVKLDSKLGTAPVDLAGNSLTGSGTLGPRTITVAATQATPYLDALDPAADADDWYRFTLPPTGAAATALSNLIATLSGLTSNADLELWKMSGSGTAATWAVYGGASSVVESAYGETFGAEGLAAGTYALHVSGAASATNYGLTVVAAVDDYAAGIGSTGSFAAATATAGLYTAGGNIQAAGDVDWFQVVLDAGVWTVRQSGAGSAGKLADPLLYGLYGDADGDGSFSLIAGSGNDDADGSTKDAQVVFSVSAGTYYVAASAFGGATGAYGLTLSSSNQAPVVANALPDRVVSEGFGAALRLPWNTFQDANGDALTLTWANQADLVDAGVTWLSFDATARMFVASAVPAGAPDIVVRVQASDGHGGLVSDDFVIRTSAAVDDFAAGTGSTGSLAAGYFDRGGIDAASDVDWFKIVLAAGQAYVVDLKGAASAAGSLADPLLLGLYDSAGSVLTGGFTAVADYAGSTDARLFIDSGAGGTFFVAAAGAAEATGSYIVSLSATGNAVPAYNGAASTFLTDAEHGQAYLEAREGQAFAYTLPGNLFTDDGTAALSYAATLANGAALPAWLTFNPATRSFAGTATAGAADLAVRVTARDELGQVAASEFTVRTPVASGEKKAAWTLLVYVAADSAQSALALKDLNELEGVKLPDNVNIVVQWDGAAGNDTKRGRLTYDPDMGTFKSTLSPVSATVLEKNMGDGATLTEFLDWGSANYRADHYALVVWDRAGGGYTGLAVDATSGRDSLSAGDLARALGQSSIGSLDMVGLDSNLTGNLETVRELAPLADFIVTPESVAKADGWDYTGWLLKLAADPTMDPNELAGAALNAYSAYYGLTPGVVLQGVESGQVGELVSALRAFVNEAGDMVDIQDDLLAAADAHRLTGDAGQVDLRGFMADVVADLDLSADLRDAADSVSAALTAALGADGSLALFVSGSAGAAAADYNGTNYRFVADSGWNSFVTTLYS
ncbi:MAG TPA: clostripain-related cysteine peptidase, partial [Rhodocyclaceae bacterium]|nr:clostripain-related cysteine peptidase [Rhodocyclaceae bacterium]